MEGVFCKTSATDAPVMNPVAAGEVPFLKTKFPSKERTPDNDELSEKKENIDVCGVNGSERNIEIPKITEPQKMSSSSPTLIGSAFKVMKNLFSPEKLKSVHSGVLSPINQQKNAAGPPCGSVYLSGKTEVFCTEPGIQAAESLKSSIIPQANELGQIQSPLPVDNLNNTDESFLTTVSLIDDSFHSAVTDFDDNGDSVKVDPKFAAVLLKSPGSDFIDPCNDTLGTNESYLENTTLKIGTPEGKSSSSPGGKGSPKLDRSPSCSKFFTKNYDYPEIPQENELLRKEGKIINVVNGSVDADKKDVFEKPAFEGIKTYEKMEMAHLFLNKSFEKSSSQQSGISVIDFNSFVPDTWKYNEKESQETQEKASETVLENADNENAENIENDENDDNVGNVENVAGDNISTTTIVLETGRELDNMSHEAGDFEIRAPSHTSVVGDNAPSPEDAGKIFPVSHSLNVKENSNSGDKWLSPAEARMLSPEKNSGGDGNSPSSPVHPIKMKLNKSDECINHRISSEPLDVKNNCSMDISLMKNVGNSELSEGYFLGHQPEVGKTESDSVASKHETASIASQLSYTILINHNNVLNRPVVDSGSFNNSGHQAGKEGIQEKSTGKTRASASSDASFDRTFKMKQSTPLANAKKEKGRTFRSSSLKFCSPEPKEGGGKAANEPDKHHGAKSKLPSTGIDLFPSGETPQGLSPVSPGEGKEFVYSMGSDILSDSATAKDTDEPNRSPGKMNETFEKVHQSKKDKKTISPGKKVKAASPKKYRDTHKLNSTFDKSPLSPKSKKCNSTFVKSKTRVETEAERTFDVAGSSPETSHLNKTYDKPGDQLNQTFDVKAEGLGARKLNETFDKKQPESPLHSKINQIVGSYQEKIAQEMNKTFDSVPIAETSETNEAGEGGQKEMKPADAPSKEVQPESNVPPSEMPKLCNIKDLDSPASSKNSVSLVSSDFSTALLNDDIFLSNDSIDFGKQEKTELNTRLAEKISLQGMRDPPPDEQAEEKLLSSLKDDKLQYDPELVQLIQEQFSSNDIEKICSVVQDLSSLKLSNDIMRASEQFDRSFHGSISEADADVKSGEKPLSPKSFDFLSSIGGKATGRDWSRESLYVKFDPLVQTSGNSLIDFTKEGEALPPMDDSPVNPHNTSICEQLLNISPQKKAADIVPPLTPLSHKTKADENDSKNERLKELQNEIYFLKNLYAEREKSNKARMEDCENRLAQLTGDVCILEGKLKESTEREKSLVKKVQEQAQSIGQLNVIMQEYMNVISKLTLELETLKAETEKQLESLSTEKDSYMQHLQNTEAAFTDVHTKYEKSKKTIASLKANEALFRNTIAEQGRKLEDLKNKAREAEERASEELQKARDDLNEAKSSHVQENARLRAQLRKTELKLEALQESLDQKVKENQQLTAICDDLIEGKK